jgi:hypothetical protein
MSVEITHVRYESSTHDHETIIRYKWRDPGDGQVGDNDKPSMVDFLDNKNGKAHVGSGSSRVEVGTVHPSSGSPFLRTYADGKWTNNLLSLPTF